MTVKTPGKGFLTCIFLIGNAIFAIFFALGLVPMSLGEYLPVIAPVCAAIFTGFYWRGRLEAIPVWADRRPVTRHMALILVLVSVLFQIFSGFQAIQSFNPDLSTLDQIRIAITSWLPRIFPYVLLVIGAWILISMIQTEIGVYIGLWLRERLIRRMKGRI